MEDKNAKCQEIEKQLPPIPVGVTFSLQKVKVASLPHPFMITSRHIEAAQKYGWILSTAACDEAPCGMRGCQLKASQHESMITVYLKVPQNRDLNAIAGLGAWCQQVKDLNLGVEGFAFQPDVCPSTKNSK